MRKNIKVLVVDDVPDNLKLFKLTLASLEKEVDLDLVVHSVSSGEEAVKTIKTESFDLILCDERLGGMSGTSVFAEFKDYSKANASVPFIIISAKNTAKDWGEFFKSGVTDFIPKPISPDKLKFICRAALTSKELRDDLKDTRNKLESAEAAIKTIREGKSQ
jgi:CheY-like chemotaxis protein